MPAKPHIRLKPNHYTLIATLKKCNYSKAKHQWAKCMFNRPRPIMLKFLPIMLNNSPIMLNNMLKLFKICLQILSF